MINLNQQEYNKQWHIKNRPRRLDYLLEKRYGITREIYNNLLLKQNNKCKICNKENFKTRTLDVDHCHKTGRIRGLLCTSCNTGIGLFKENIQLLETAIQYLKENKI